MKKGVCNPLYYVDQRVKSSFWLGKWGFGWEDWWNFLVDGGECLG
ncbi:MULTISPECIES: hypothetical protein [unclassified Flavobacterium]|nr:MULTISPECIES: hypothetical protein [unclassified Flavobacterium]